jgi:hypothetical protein
VFQAAVTSSLQIRSIEGGSLCRDSVFFRFSSPFCSVCPNIQPDSFGPEFSLQAVEQIGHKQVFPVGSHPVPGPSVAQQLRPIPEARQR